jgi:aminoglycoside phosphotransferase (APT) family kinase protein
MGEEGDARLEAARVVLHRLTARRSPLSVIRDELSLLVRQDEVLVRVRPRAAEPTAAREVEVAGVLAEAGVPALALVEPSGQPWVEGNWVLTAWRWHDTIGAATPEDLGTLACLLHERTAGTFAYDVARFDPLAAIRNAVSSLPIGDEQGDFVRRRAQELSSEWAAVADRDPTGTSVVHGDLHADNVLSTAEGPLLADLELAGAGPAAYDVAPAVVATERYGAPDSDLDRFLSARGDDPRTWSGFATCLAVYELWVTAWAVGVRDSSPQAAAEAALRVRCLRDGACEPWTLR